MLCAHRRAWTRVLPVSILVTLTGCGNLVTRPWVIANSKPGDDLGGVPFTLNSPALTVSRVPGQDGAPDVFAISTTYKPDPSRRYVLKVDPAILSSVDWTLTLDENGSLSDSNASITDNLPALITSVGKLAAAGIGAGARTPLGGAGAQDCTPPVQPVDAPPMDAIAKAASQVFSTIPAKIAAPRAECLGPTLPPDQPLRCWIEMHDVEAPKKHWASLLRSMEELDTKGRLRSAFAYESAPDRQLLVTVLRQLQATKPSIPASVRAGKSSSNTTVKSKAFDIADSLATFDRRRLQAIKADAQKSVTNLYLQYSTLPESKKDLDAHREVLAMSKDALAAIGKPIDILLDVVDIDPREWQTRRVAHLNARLEELLQHRRVSGLADDELAKSIEGVAKERARVLDVAAEWQRRSDLQSQIDDPKSPREVKALMDEIAFLDKRISDAEAAIKLPKKETKAADPQPAPYLLRDKALDALLAQKPPADPCKPSPDLEAFRAAMYRSWISQKLGSARPPYVVVMEPMPEEGK